MERDNVGATYLILPIPTFTRKSQLYQGGLLRTNFESSFSEIGSLKAVH
jgi:hypothetical protein